MGALSKQSTHRSASFKYASIPSTLGYSCCRCFRRPARPALLQRPPLVTAVGTSGCASERYWIAVTKSAARMPHSRRLRPCRAERSQADHSSRRVVGDGRGVDHQLWWPRLIWFGVRRQSWRQVRGLFEELFGSIESARACYPRRPAWDISRSQPQVRPL